MVTFVRIHVKALTWCQELFKVLDICSVDMSTVDMSRHVKTLTYQELFINVKNNILVQLHTVDLYKIPLKLSGIYLIFLIIQWDPGLFGRYIWSRFTGSNLGPRLLSNVFGISWLWLRRWFSACTANVKPAWAALGQPGHFPWLCPIERLHKTIYLLLA